MTKARLIQVGTIEENGLGGVTVSGWHIEFKRTSDSVPVLKILPNREVLFLGYGRDGLELTSRIYSS
jgi:hypothetical protein